MFTFSNYFLKTYAYWELLNSKRPDNSGRKVREPFYFLTNILNKMKNNIKKTLARIRNTSDHNFECWTYLTIPAFLLGFLLSGWLPHQLPPIGQWILYIYWVALSINIILLIYVTYKPTKEKK
jgi:hypothetical protein